MVIFHGFSCDISLTFIGYNQNLVWMPMLRVGHITILVCIYKQWPIYIPQCSIYGIFTNMYRMEHTGISIFVFLLLISAYHPGWILDDLHLIHSCGSTHGCLVRPPTVQGFELLVSGFQSSEPMIVAFHQYLQINQQNYRKIGFNFKGIYLTILLKIAGNFMVADKYLEHHLEKISLHIAT